MRTKKITIEPYSAQVYLATSKKAWRMLGVEKDQAAGFVVRHKSKLYIGLHEEYDEEAVWHEAHHAARMINKSHGIDTDHDEHEIDAYMQEHIVRLIKSTLYNM